MKRIIDYLLKLKRRINQLKECNKILSSLSVQKISRRDVKNIKKYYGQYTKFKINTCWHELYVNSGQHFDVRFIPIDFLFIEIIPKLNNMKFVEAYSDKSQYELHFANVKLPKTILKRISGDFYFKSNIISEEKALGIISKLHDLVVKPTINTSQGNGVFIFSNHYSIEEIRQKFLYEIGDNYIIQEKIVAHPIINSFNSTSLNTIRLISYRNGSDVRILSAVLKIGKNGEIADNGHAGGYFCGISEDGRLKKYLYTLSPFTKQETTENGIYINNIQIPNFEILKNKVCELALRLPYARFAGWDMAIDCYGEPVLIEVNLKCPGGNIMQIPNGPLFGNDTDIILHEIINLNSCEK